MDREKPTPEELRAIHDREQAEPRISPKEMAEFIHEKSTNRAQILAVRSPIGQIESWERSVESRTANPEFLLPEYNFLLKLVKERGTPFFGQENKEEFYKRHREAEYCLRGDGDIEVSIYLDENGNPGRNEEGRIIISNKAVVNRSSLRKAVSDEPSRIGIYSDGRYEIRFPAANSNLPKDRSNHPEQWDEERIKNYIREKILPLFEIKE